MHRDQLLAGPPSNLLAHLSVQIMNKWGQPSYQAKWGRVRRTHRQAHNFKLIRLREISLLAEGKSSSRCSAMRR